MMTGSALKLIGLLMSLSFGPHLQPGAGRAQEEALFLSRDESTLERQIYAYITEQHGVRGDIDFYGNTTDDLMILYKLNSDGDAPHLTMYVDSIVTNRSSDGTVLERGIQVNGFYLLDEEDKDAETVLQILELNNRFAEEYWVPHQVYLDSDHDLIFSSVINIPGKQFSVHPELVWDLLVRSLSAWTEYYVHLQDILD